VFASGFDVAAGDLNGDGKADVVVSRASSGPTIFVYSGADIANPPPAHALRPATTFTGIGDSNFTGGTTVAVGDVNADGTPDVVVGAGSGGGPRVAVFDGHTLLGGQTPGRLFNDFFALDPALRTGVNVAVMDVNRDGHGDVLVGAASGAPEMVAIDGAVLLTSSGGTVTKFWDQNFGPSQSKGGAQMAVKDVDGDKKPDLTIANADRATVLVFRASFLHTDGTTSFGPQAFDAPASADDWVG
jgi:hypothetical protein